MKKLICLLLAWLWCVPALAETQVWGLRGAGFEAWSQGIDQIAEQARQIPGVAFVRVFNYDQTQQVYDEIAGAPRGTRIAIYGYSCGANAAVVVANSFRYHRNIAEVLGMQPSVWCGGGYESSLHENTGYGQNTYAPCWQTVGLGCQQWYGARRMNQIERSQRHLYADEDPAYQQDVLGAISYLAGYVVQCNPARHACHGHTVIIHRAPGGGITHHLIHR
jgi:hypothetical protein